MPSITYSGALDCFVILSRGMGDVMPRTLISGPAPGAPLDCTLKTPFTAPPSMPSTVEADRASRSMSSFFSDEMELVRLFLSLLP